MKPNNSQEPTTTLTRDEDHGTGQTACEASFVALDEKEQDRLGRQRPEVFSSTLREVGFCASVLLSNIMAEFLISGFNVLLPSLTNELNFLPAEKTWPSSVFSLVAGAFLLPFGRLSDMYGGFPVFLAGNAWMATWSLIGGFSQNYVMLVVCRALQGLGAAAFLPSGISLLGNIYRPGRRKNIVFSLYGGCAPLGFFTGILVAGISGQFLRWSWFFWIGCMLLAVVCTLVFFCVPRQIYPARMAMDWWGCGTSIPGLMLLVYAITDSPHVDNGWASPQILATFHLGIIFIGAFVYVEGWVSTAPLLPRQLFAPKYTIALFCCLCIAFGSFGIYLLYASFYIETILHIEPLLAAAWFAPLAIGGIVIAIVGSVVLHKLPGTILLLLSVCGFLVSSLLFIFIPNDPNYWAWVLPAMTCATVGIDIMYNVSNIFITTSMKSDQQGIAGACVNGLLFLGMSFFLGWADLASAAGGREDLKSGYKIALTMGAACAGASILIIAFGIRIDRAKGDLTADEREQLQRAGGKTSNGLSCQGNESSHT
ncbi:major facilitator superfamily transporter [Colletotrichum incanum]|uniref:Major facilitator superfamily transporter n=1 Tax=Colletotrichum incanum TaxID=1573173 RepID=A0A167EFW3_COLIC|nr:major facilitator superfamily transporter [Colletotrichum incanum]